MYKGAPVENSIRVPMLNDASMSMDSELIYFYKLETQVSQLIFQSSYQMLSCFYYSSRVGSAASSAFWWASIRGFKNSILRYRMEFRLTGLSLSDVDLLERILELRNSSPLGNILLTP
jgi:hypothetical protein